MYGTIAHARLISTGEVVDMFPGLGKDMVYKVLSSLQKKGRLYRIKQGMYLVQKRPSHEPVIEDPYEIALALYSGYIGFSSALRLYDLMEYEPFTVFVVTPHTSRTREIGDYTFRAVAMGELAVGMTSHRGLYVSSLEKTFFDCFYKPQHAGGYGTVTKALYDKGGMDWNRFLDYFQRFASHSLCQRTGYVLDRMQRELDFEVPERVVSFFLRNRGDRTKLIPTAPSRGSYSGKWNILDNTGSLLGWYHGY